MEKPVLSVQNFGTQAITPVSVSQVVLMQSRSTEKPVWINVIKRILKQLWIKNVLCAVSIGTLVITPA